MVSHRYWTPESVVEGKWVTPESERERQKERKEAAIQKKKKEERIRKKHRGERKKKAAEMKKQQEKASWKLFGKVFGCICCVACICLSIIGASVIMMYAF